MTNSTGTKIQTYAYDSFGNFSQDGNMRPTPRWIKQPFTYTAREFDSETGLYYYRARYYDAKVGRFITKDPIGFDGGDVNLYVYVGNNPINWIDPFGLAILICNRKTDWGVGNHAYLWDTISRRSCGMQGSSGSGDIGGDEKGPDGCSGDDCIEIPNSNGKEDTVWKCCNDPAQINRGPWIPGINDCHSRAGHCLSKAGLDDPGAPGGRLGKCKSCWLDKY